MHWDSLIEEEHGSPEGKFFFKIIIIFIYFNNTDICLFFSLSFETKRLYALEL